MTRWIRRACCRAAARCLCIQMDVPCVLFRACNTAMIRSGGRSRWTCSALRGPATHQRNPDRPGPALPSTPPHFMVPGRPSPNPLPKHSGEDVVTPSRAAAMRKAAPSRAGRAWRVEGKSRDRPGPECSARAVLWARRRDVEARRWERYNECRLIPQAKSYTFEPFEHGMAWLVSLRRVRPRRGPDHCQQWDPREKSLA